MPGLLTWAVLLFQSFRMLDDVLLTARRLAGGGGRSRGLRLAAIVACLAVLLQGCNFDVPTHSDGNWRAEPDYLITYEFVPPGASPRAAMLNSCSLPQLSQTVQCGGRGVCRVWDESNFENPMSFCFCDRDWADPECSTKRKSQVVAYLLSVFLGPFGADRYYLGLPISATVKLCTSHFGQA